MQFHSAFPDQEHPEFIEPILYYISGGQSDARQIFENPSDYRADIYRRTGFMATLKSREIMGQHFAVRQRQEFEQRGDHCHVRLRFTELVVKKRERWLPEQGTFPQNTQNLYH